jgi:hypothetical protein
MPMGEGPVNSSKVAEAGIEPAQASFRATCSYQQERLRRKMVAETTGDEGPFRTNAVACRPPQTSGGGLPQVHSEGTNKAAREGIEPSTW